MSLLKQLIEAIVKPLVDFPEDVRIETDDNESRIVYKLFVHPEDRKRFVLLFIHQQAVTIRKRHMSIYWIKTYSSDLFLVMNIK